MSKEGRRGSSTHTEMDIRTDAVNPDSLLAWVAVIAAFTCNVISDGIVFSFGIIQAEAVVFFEEPVAKVAWVFAIMNSISLILAPLASAFSNRYGFRMTVFSGGLLGFIGLTSSSFATSVDSLLITTGVLVGLAVCLVYTTVAASGSYYCSRRRVLGTSIILCGTGTGSFLMPPIINWLIEEFALHGTYMILGALYLNCALLGLLMFPVTTHQPKKRISLFMRTNKREKTASKIETEIIIKNDCAQKSAYSPNLKTLCETLKLSLFKSPTFLVFCLSSFLLSLGILVPHIYLPAHAVNMGIDKTSAAFLLSIEAVINVIGKIIVGFVCDHPKVNLLIVSNFGYTLMGVLTLLLTLYTTYGWLIFYTVWNGVATCLASVGGIVLMTRFLGLENANSAYGFVLMFFGFGSLIGMPLAGWLYDKMGNYFAAFQYAGVAMLLSATVCYPLGYINRWERKRNSSCI